MLAIILSSLVVNVSRCGATDSRVPQWLDMVSVFLSLNFPCVFKIGMNLNLENQISSCFFMIRINLNLENQISNWQAYFSVKA